MARYTIHKILDAQCSEIGDEVLAKATTLQQASDAAARNSNWVFGSAIKNTCTGEIDFGYGFGVALEDAGVDEDGTRY